MYASDVVWDFDNFEDRFSVETRCILRSDLVILSSQIESIYRLFVKSPLAQNFQFQLNASQNLLHLLTSFFPQEQHSVSQFSFGTAGIIISFEIDTTEQFQRLKIVLLQLIVTFFSGLLYHIKVFYQLLFLLSIKINSISFRLNNGFQTLVDLNAWSDS